MFSGHGRLVGRPRTERDGEHPHFIFVHDISTRNHGAAAYGDFLLGAFKNPRRVSALTPSSPSLARAIADEVDMSRQGQVVELGPGTGAVTGALLARGIAPERLLLIECEVQFVRVLRELYPFLDVRFGDALKLKRHIAPSSQICAIVSGLPLLHLPAKTRRRLVNDSLACQGEGGLFVQLSYGWHPPAPVDRGTSVTKKIVWSNFPPAHVWTYRNV